MRIISGYLKCKKINLPKDNLTRPLKDLTKESIFNILQHSNLINFDLKKSIILDLFSGVGSFGLECISRGAQNVIFCENYPATIVVSFVGYQKYSRLIKELNNYHIVLSPSIELDAVEVQSKVNTTKFSTINTINMQTLSTGELEKAACCNLSESFGTNASVDVNFTDAVSGAKQIQMLGLDGVYAQITQENMPLIRGVSSAFGLNYVPGTWIESIQVIKGTGSVVNGFESLVGQINLEYFKPESAPKLFWNMYSN